MLKLNWVDVEKVYGFIWIKKNRRDDEVNFRLHFS